MVTLTLPYPPSVNGLYATVYGRRVLSEKGREYHKLVIETVKRQTSESFGSRRIRYVATAFPPDKRRRDLSNLTKAMEDALTKSGIWNDDSQVDDFRWIRGESIFPGSVFIEIEEI